MKKILIVLLSVLLILISLMCFTEQRANETLKEKVETLEKENTQLKENIENENIRQEQEEKLLHNNFDICIGEIYEE